MASLSSRQFYKYNAQGDVSLKVSAPGKVILHGEHSVVYGKLALAASLDLRTKLHLFEIDLPNKLVLNCLPLDFKFALDLNFIQELLDKRGACTSQPSHFNWETPKFVNHHRLVELVKNLVIDAVVVIEENPSRSREAYQTVEAILYLLAGILSSTSVSLSPMCITIDSEISMGAGTGSSASLSVAFAALFVSYLKRKTIELENVSKDGFRPFHWPQSGPDIDNQYTSRELDVISAWAFQCEMIFHGTPSGIDNTVCTFGNMVQYRQYYSVVHLSFNTLNLLLVNSKVPRETKRMVAGVAKLKEYFPHLINYILNAMEDVTVTATDVIKIIDEDIRADDVVNKARLIENFDKWMTLIQINHNLLSSLGVSHEKLDLIITILKKHELAGKLTGGGGGGYVISVLPPSYDVDEVSRELKKHNFEVTVTQMGGPGVRVD
uniref:Mevalonate kinase n=1 Tax=Dendroctonus rhizophagus TaxID=77169 RepID=A0A5B7LH12_9CUCU|nr:mevalonate kinase [Dendroctonus rhizophagus]